MRFTQQVKYEIIRLVDISDLSANRTLKELGIYKRTFYNWYKRYLEDRCDGLASKAKGRHQTWNKIPPAQQDQVVELTLEHAELSSRELTFLFMPGLRQVLEKKRGVRPKNCSTLG
jgi:putative transposase